MAISQKRRTQLQTYVKMLHSKLSDMPYIHRPSFSTDGLRPDNLYKLSSGQKSATVLANRMLLYLGIPATAVVNLYDDIAQQSQSAGQFSGDYTDCHINIYNKPYYTTKNIEAIMAHECTHCFLSYKRISLPHVKDNELLTDIACVFLGFGPLLQDGYAPIQISDSESAHIGYLTPEEIKYVLGTCVKLRSASAGPCKRKAVSMDTDEISNGKARGSGKALKTFYSPFLIVVIISIVLSATVVVLATSLVSKDRTNNALLTENNELKVKLTDLDNSLSDTKHTLSNTKYLLSHAQKDLSDAQNELQFWHGSAVIVTTTGNKYHTYGCAHIGNNPFYIYNLDDASAKGYTPCLDCQPPIPGQIITKYDASSNILPPL